MIEGNNQLMTSTNSSAANDSSANEQAALVRRGWEFLNTVDGLCFAINHERRLLTFRYKSSSDLIEAINSEVFDDPGSYEVYFDLPNC